LIDFERRIASDQETALDLAINASESLFQEHPVFRDQIDYVIFCTQSPDYLLPSNACVIQAKLGLKKEVGAFDVNLGCSGFVYGLQLADAIISNGSAGCVLLLTADTYSKYIHPKDRTVRALFGDGAAATIIAAPTANGKISTFEVGTDGTGFTNLLVPSGGSRLPKDSTTAMESTDAAGCVRSKNNIYMNGPEIFVFALSTVPRILKKVLSSGSLSISDVDHFVFHQANKFMLESLAKRCGIPNAKMVIDVEKCGNLVSSSIPVALRRMEDRQSLNPGDRVVLVGFGVGYSWGACEVIWGP
jgi:3-oxoacyl-[acyl-carrier-protein] synthase-3